MGSSSQPATTTTQNVLAPEQRQLLGMAMPHLQNFANQPLTQPNAAQSIVPFNANQIGGQNAALASTMAQNDILRSAGMGNQFLTSGDALNPNTNPGLQGTIDAATRPIMESWTDTILPTIRGQAAFGQGGMPSANYGGSRQGVAEGIAGRGVANAIGDATSKIAFQGYNTGLDAMLKGIGLAPGTATAQTIPGLTQSGVGDVQANLAQRQLTADTAAAMFPQWADYIKGSALLGGVSAIPQAGAISTGPQPNQPGVGSALTGAAGGAMAGASLGSVVPGIGTGVGALGGAALGGLLPFIQSDMRSKRDIVRIGTLFDGTPVYRYRYAGNQTTHIGVMAQDIEKFAPEAVSEIGGFKLVNMELATRRAMEANHGDPTRPDVQQSTSFDVGRAG